jgi:hypothetical protein
MSKYVAVTFDLDFTNYLNENDFIDEFELAWPHFLDFCEKIKDLYGSEDFIFIKHGEKIKWLRANGHEIGWHFHSYVKIENKWVQNTNDDLVVEEMINVFPKVHEHQLEISRMGWTYHTNKTMKTLVDLGIKNDFTAFPRPKYQWDSITRDWQITPLHIYKPSKNDYRTTGESFYELNEIPITSVVLPAKTDTEKEVIRYINPAYKAEYFEIGLNNVKDINTNQ